MGVLAIKALLLRILWSIVGPLIVGSSHMVATTGICRCSGPDSGGQIKRPGGLEGLVDKVGCDLLHVRIPCGCEEQRLPLSPFFHFLDGLADLRLETLAGTVNLRGWPQN